MPIVNVTLPSDGTGADVGDYNPAILAILAVLNGHIASDNIEPGSLDWSVMSGTMTNVIPSTAMQDSGSMEKWRDEANIGFTASGLVWSALTGLNATMTAGIQYTPDGLRRSISAVTSRTFTASKDTYISISPAGAIAYTEVANNAAQPALGTDYRWLAKVVTSVSAITSVTDMRQTAVIGSQNIDWATLTNSGVPVINGITLGNATVSYKWWIIGKLVHVELHIIGGTTTSASGLVEIPLPVPPAAYYYSQVWQHYGYGIMTDEGSFVYDVVVASKGGSSTYGTLIVKKADTAYVSTSTQVSSTTPFPFGNNDKLSISMDYEAA